MAAICALLIGMVQSLGAANATVHKHPFRPQAGYGLS